MGCACVQPPPEFNVPPPPDPSLIWHLLSDEPPDELIEIQQCDAAEHQNSTGDVIPILSIMPGYVLYAMLASGALISATLILLIAFISIRRSNSRSRKKVKKSELASNVILRSEDWPYGTSTLTAPGAGSSHMLYNAHNDIIVHRTASIGPNSLRHQSLRKPGNFLLTPTRNQLNRSSSSLRHSTAAAAAAAAAVTSLRQKPTTTLRLHGCNEGYCTLGHYYEEIPQNLEQICWQSPMQQQKQQRQLIYAVSSVRRPPPACRPPPPPALPVPEPSPDSPLSANSSSASMNKELDNLNSSCSQKRSTDDDKSRNSGETGRESGYDTAPTRFWRGTVTTPCQTCEPFSRRSLENDRRHTPLAVFAHRTNSAHPMTYV